MLEKTSNVFKQGYSDDLYQEIVSFLNSCKGKILIGYDENGTLIGLDDAKFLKEKITKEILNKITPNCSMFVTIDNLSLDNKDYIVINVNKGIDIYFLKDKFLFDGIYVRKDSYSVPCTFEIVKQMIIQNYNLNYEWGISMNQNLSFDYIIKKFKEIGQDINDDCVQKNLHLKNNDGQYTNLALILSDQSPYVVKTAIYYSKDKRKCIDHKIFEGSIFKIYDNVIPYLKYFSTIKDNLNSNIKEDVEEYPEFILRELVLNFLTHRDYSTMAPNIINIYKNDSMEFINYGSLSDDLTVDDILSGVSMPQNPYLKAVIERFNNIGFLDSGLKSISSFYQERKLDFKLKVLSSSFIVSIPRIPLEDDTIDITNESNVYYDKQIMKVLNYLKKYQEITRKEAEQIIDRTKITTLRILNEMVTKGLIVPINKGPAQKYILKE